jgi:hypothetical protein
MGSEKRILLLTFSDYSNIQNSFQVYTHILNILLCMETIAFQGESGKCREGRLKQYLFSGYKCWVRRCSAMRWNSPVSKDFNYYRKDSLFLYHKSAYFNVSHVIHNLWGGGVWFNSRLSYCFYVMMEDPSLWISHFLFQIRASSENPA